MLHRMHRDEWLDDAKRVPLGQSRRVFHGAETRRNLVVYNNPDSYSAYCHSCRTSARVYKEVYQKVVEAPPKMLRYLNTKSLITLSALAKEDAGKYAQIVRLLHQKGMSTALLDDYVVRYSPDDDRLVLRLPYRLDVGRDISGSSPAKWMVYGDPERGYVHLQGKGSYAVLTEDLFSAIKVNHYTGLHTVWNMGTRVSNEITNLLHTNGYTAVLAFDGDAAGNTATVDYSRRLSLCGLAYKVVNVPDGLDPKDLSHLQLTELFQEFIC